ncbi:hypothetical protein ACE5IS_18590 [Leptospira wolffii]|uniref:Lipoprotein n=1 Tax=Leptospira wolffii TaxID=409998 RepID=A0A2M9ZH28_9LEPT|nr:lipoprotein [Leptospira wolffii]EPG64491.1 putative lipoprotein [Leptospira wolffii serovar Khorat str. Khorat-H2]PJZ67731.1 hypothetical protein CH371_06955 [Leptospira wolffii]TGK62739.1 hypothetical protein EHQ32_08015 [Leptospira wolffii]TGK73874.1 hypothetical protein EHQ35_05750 [Leptospira wolffii]TGK75029.1 hypothetical protein EHQ27_05585 [Leptospira wolffii]
MKRILVLFTLCASIALSVGCSSTPVIIPAQPAPAKVEKDQRLSTFPVYAEACGFQLLLFIPINVNTRQASAFQKIQFQAYGGTLSDIRMEESWFYGLVGTGYCTKFSALVTRAQ